MSVRTDLGGSGMNKEKSMLKSLCFREIQMMKKLFVLLFLCINSWSCTKPPSHEGLTKFGEAMRTTLDDVENLFEK